MRRGEEAGTSTQGLYGVLGVDANASEEEIKGAYRKAAFICHPDRTKNEDGQFERVYAAYAVLSDAKKRLLYDMLGDKILPSLLEQKYAPYIDLCTSKQAVCLLTASAVLLPICTVFYPYLALLVRLDVFPRYIVTAVPHCVLYLIFIWAVVKFAYIGKKISSRSVNAVLEVTLWLALFLLSLLAVDGDLSSGVLYGLFALSELGFLFLRAMKSSTGSGMEEGRRRITVKKFLSFLFEIEYLAKFFTRAVQAYFLVAGGFSPLCYAPPLLYPVLSTALGKMRRGTAYLALGCSVYAALLLLWVNKRSLGAWDIAGLVVIGVALLAAHLLIAAAVAASLVALMRRGSTRLALPG